MEGYSLVFLLQAFTLSLAAASYHDSHLEVALSVSDLHRELAFGGLPIGIGVGDASARVRIDHDNTPYFEVHNGQDVISTS